MKWQASQVGWCGADALPTMALSRALGLAVLFANLPCPCYGTPVDKPLCAILVVSHYGKMEASGVGAAQHGMILARAISVPSLAGMFLAKRTAWCERSLT